jgi:ribosomal protein S2
MEKRRFRMGIKTKSFTSVKKLKLDFMSSQSHWGHHKQILNHSLNSYLLGVKNDFTLFNPGYFIEFSKRCAIFCSNIISNDGQVLFINSNNEFKKCVVFFGSRSLQPIYSHEWVAGSITNNFIKTPSVLVATNLSKDSYILKEALKVLIPVITIEDSNYNLHKAFYSSFANDDNKVSICYFYSFLTDHIIKSLLYNYVINRNSLV